MSNTNDVRDGGSPGIHEVSVPERRTLLRMSFGAAAGALFGPGLVGCASPAVAGPRLGFKGIAPSTADELIVPPGYRAQVLAPWGDPVGLPNLQPRWKSDASNSAEEQAAQLGMHHDGMHFYPLAGSSTRGVLMLNHEYVDHGLLFADGNANWSAEKVRKSQAAHGISAIEVALEGGRWQVQRPSRYARRITANTPCAVGGPAAGHVLMRTAADPAGTRILGTFNNCAAGTTPWGTYLSGEENFDGYFAGGDFITEDQRRYGLRRRSFYGWEAHDERFDTRKHPNEFHRHGWVVEVDPLDPTSVPVKRTAIGRAVHEGAWVAVTKDGRAVVYSGEDEAFHFIYKFVSRDRIAPGGAKANATLLDHGTLYVARFDADGRGRWLPLVHGQGPLVAANGFADQGEVVIKARQAAGRLGATPMDRPEWLAIDPHSNEVYCSLTNNRDRGAPGLPGVDAANPRQNNTMGQIIRWKEDGDFDGTSFRWNHLLLAGEPSNSRPEAQGNVRGDAFSSPDTIAFDGRGVLWIGTDISQRSLNQGEMAALGNNALLACDVATGEVRRFLTGPRNCELAACTFTPDGTTLFINIQHPGENPAGTNSPESPQRFSNWPDGAGGGRPRSAIVAVRREDGGVIGS